MTREKAIKGLKVLRKDFSGYKPNEEMFDMAIKALEQEPCEDCVNRAEVVDELNRLGRNAFKDDTDYDNFFAFIDSLPSVTPTRKKGKWEHGYSFPDGNYAKCTACGEIIKCTFPMHFCPNCNADMREETNG